MAIDDQHALLLDIGARLTGLEKSFDRAAGVVKSRSRQMEQSATSLERFFGKPSLAKAMDKTFDATRFKILDSGAARVGLFGSALESLGPIGLTAAGAIGAVTLALTQAHAAMEFADALDDTAKRLHVTTDALQEYRYAIRLAGGDAKGADEALETFSVTLGKAQEGLAKGQRGFLALGFTKEQIKGFHDVDSALKAVTDRINKLGSNVQKDAVINQLGLDGLKPLILEGADAMTRLRQEAHKAGVVMDAELIKRAADSKETFTTLSQVIDMQLKQAFVDLAPTLIQIMGLLAEMARIVGRIADSFRGIKDKTAAGLEDEADKAMAEIEKRQNNLRRFTGPNDAAHRAAIQRDIDNWKARLNDIRFEQRLNWTPAPPVPSGTSLIDNSGAASRGPTPAEIAARQNRLRLETELATAEAEHNKNAIEAAQRELAILHEQDQLKQAGLAYDRTAAIARVDALAASQAIGQAIEDQGKAQEKLNDALKNTARKEQEIADEKDRQRAADKQDAADAARAADDKLRDDIKRQLELTNNLHDAQYEATYDAIRGAFDALAEGRVWEYFVNRLKAAMLDNIAQSLATAFMGGPSGGGGPAVGPFARLAGAIFGGARASGGPVSTGAAYMVGERGPELFVPNVSGMIRPNGAGGVVQHFTIDARGALGVDQLISFIEHRSQAAESRAVSRTLANVSRSSAMRLA